LYIDEGGGRSFEPFLRGLTLHGVLATGAAELRHL
jgi:hypothetical protein